MYIYHIFFNGKKEEIESTSLYSAKLLAISKWKIPKNKQGLLSVVYVGVKGETPKPIVADF